MKTETETTIKYVDMKHKRIWYEQDGTETIGEICDGKVYWDEGIEGYCCSKCHMNTSVK